MGDVRPVEEFVQAREGECDRFGHSCLTHDEGVMWPEYDVCELIRRMTELVRARNVEVVDGCCSCPRHQGDGHENAGASARKTE